MKRRSSRLVSATSATLALLVCVVTVGGCANQPQREIGWCTIGGGVGGAVLGGALGIGLGGYKGLDNCCHEDSVAKAVVFDVVGVTGGLVLGAVAGHYICDPIVSPPAMAQSSTPMTDTTLPSGPSSPISSGTGANPAASAGMAAPASLAAPASPPAATTPPAPSGVH
jgi:hypothetical protein